MMGKGDHGQRYAVLGQPRGTEAWEIVGYTDQPNGGGVADLVRDWPKFEDEPLVADRRPDGGEEVPLWIARALALVEQSLRSVEGRDAVRKQTGGNAPELVQGILDRIGELWDFAGA